MNLSDHAAELPRFKDYRPTQFDGHIRVDEIEEFIVVIERNRDSNILDNCNFEEVLKHFGGETPERVEVHRFGHWGCGWFELLLVHPDLAEKAAEVVCSLANYPVWDDEAYSLRQLEAAEDQWDSSGIRERLRLCQQAGISDLAARHAQCPERVVDLLLENLV